ncbi:unnamed protein product [Lactuca saligna]|uniref:Uncharacterized protein n=1 Tax=Lactuca saligna TaxID=75948 RepID=A0AA35YXK1_LACSI|nr:unnamed protein product [Lactuca saligna]
MIPKLLSCAISSLKHMWLLYYELADFAKKAGLVFPPRETYDFSVMRDFPPTWITSDVWQALCTIWDTDTWRNISESGKRNRSSSVNGSISVHTGGSITTEQHRKKMAKGKDPLWGDIFKQTHLEKSEKVKLASGELIGSQPEYWVNEKSWTVFDKYEKAMCEKYSPDPSRHSLGDVEIWEHCVGGRK